MTTLADVVQRALDEANVSTLGMGEAFGVLEGLEVDAATRATVIAEIVAWLRGTSYADALEELDDCPDWVEADGFANAIAEKFGP